MAEMSKSGQATPEANRRQLFRAVLASTVGTSIEWYDFFLYGFAASTLFATEWGKSSGGRRGFLGSWAQFGVPVGLVLGYTMLKLFQPVDPYWGWRIPFLFSIVLVGVGLYIRLRVMETPVFAKVVEQRKVEQAPVLEVIRRNWRDIILSALILTGQQAPFYIFTADIITSATKTLKFSSGEIYTDVIVSSILSLFTMPLWGYVSDLVGRKRLYVAGAALIFIWSFIYWPLLDSRVPTLVFLALILALPIHDMQYGPQASFIAESFTGRLRYSGASLGYQLASITAGGPAPLIAVYLLSTYKTSFAISVYMAITALISIGAALALKDRSKQDYAVEYDEGVPSAEPVPRPAFN